jgi:hypothetical protein
MVMEWMEMVFGIAMWSYVIYRNPFVDHILWYLIQLNWVVSACNFNIVIRC